MIDHGWIKKYGSSSFIDGEVLNYASLPTASLHSGEFWLVKEASGIYLINRKPKGLYYSDGSTWEAAPDIVPYFDDDNFEVYDHIDNTKKIKLGASGITTGTSRTLEAPDASGTIALTTDIPVAGDFNHDDLANITGTASQYNHPTDANMTVLNNTSNTNTGDQTSIADFTGTKAQFDTALSDGTFAYLNQANVFTEAQTITGTLAVTTTAGMSIIDTNHTDKAYIDLIRGTATYGADYADFRLVNDTGIFKINTESSSVSDTTILSINDAYIKLLKPTTITGTTGGFLTLKSTDTALGTGDTIGKLSFYSSDASGGGTGTSAYIESKTVDSYGVNTKLVIGVRNSVSGLGEVVSLEATAIELKKPTTITGALTVNANADVTVKLGRGKLGYDGTSSDQFVIAHYDNMNTTDFGLRLSATGAAVLNAKSGNTVYIREDNADVATFSATAISLLKPVTITGNVDFEGSTSRSIYGNQATGYLRVAYGDSSDLKSNIYFGEEALLLRFGTASIIDLSVTAISLLKPVTITGSLGLTEITTPTAVASQGKVYTKSDNKLYFQDGAGTEHEIAFV